MSETGTDEPQTAGNRIRARNEKAERYLAGASPGRQLFSRAHLGLANLFDRAGGVAGSEHLGLLFGGFGGMVMGMVGGLVVGLFLAALFPATIAAPLMALGIAGTTGAIMTTTMVAGAVIMGAVHASKGYQDQLGSDLPDKFSNIADKIAESGRAIAPSNPTRTPDKMVESMARVEFEQDAEDDRRQNWARRNGKLPNSNATQVEKLAQSPRGTGQVRT